ncbi:MAG TPA: hypothetical protein PLJ12_15780, partial [Planctomycetota bacterium]|nr:hypothetical protein [Planctomycetota bacterium]
DPDGEKKEPERLKEWPELTDKSALKEVQRLVKARTEAMGIDAAEKLQAVGAPVAPLLIKELERARDKQAIARIEDTLEVITGAPHTRLLAEEFQNKSAAVRRFALYKVARLADPGVREAAEAAYKIAAAEDTKWESRDRYLTALCCASSGSLAGWADLKELARKKWGDYRSDLSMALPHVRSDALTAEIIASVHSEERQDQVDCLRLLSVAGTRTAIDYVKPLLDSGDASIRVAAINTCRGIIDGDPPLAELSAFQAIELAKKWKDRL